MQCSPVRAIETNVHCTEVVLKHANKKKKPVLIASTSEVYGKSQALPFKEDGDMQMGATDNSAGPIALPQRSRSAGGLCHSRRSPYQAMGFAGIVHTLRRSTGQIVVFRDTIRRAVLGVQWKVTAYSHILLAGIHVLVIKSASSNKSDMTSSL
jgi:NAD dependent epimerase/dehydratase family